MAKLIAYINSLFNNKKLRKVLLKMRSFLFVLAFILLIRHIKPNLLLPGFIITMVGSMIQSWSFGSLDKNRMLAERGPYALVRNPMYLGRFLLLFGCLFLVGSVWVLLLYSICYYFYMINRVKREEEYLKNVFGATFEGYCARTNRFVPSLSRIDIRAILFFDPRLFFRNHGHWNLLAVVGSYAIFYVYTLKYIAGID